tara:strand:+ start:4523 stop:5623 length:1101 start_codon:yes stop_codon:yes gene_type:complete
VKFSAKKESLSDKFSLCSSIAEKRQTIPVLSNVLIKAKDGYLTVVATDLERQLSLKIIECEISEEGETTVSARKLFELIKSVPDDTNLNFEVKENQLEISALSFQADLAILPVQDFPFVELEDHNFSLNMNGDKFGKVLESTSFAMASADVRYYLNGLLLETSQKKINLVATDGHRLAWGSYSYSEDLEEKKIIIPRSTALELQRILNIFPEEISFSSNNSQLKVESDNFTFISKLIEGAYPDYKKVFPSGEEQSLETSKSPILTALSRSAVLSNEKFRGVKFELSKDKLKILANNPNKESAEEELEVSYSGQDLEIGFNINYVQESLNYLPDDDIEFIFFGSENSCLVKNTSNDDLVHVIMPMRL